MTSFRDSVRADVLGQVVGRHLSDMPPTTAQTWYHLMQIIHLLTSPRSAGTTNCEERPATRARSCCTLPAKAFATGRPRLTYAAAPMRSFRQPPTLWLQWVCEDSCCSLMRWRVFIRNCLTSGPVRCYRVLSALCESPDLQRCRVVLAVTPDAHRYILNDIPLMLEPVAHLACEPLRQWARRLNTDVEITSICGPLNRSGCEHLITQIREFYVCTYPHGACPPARSGVAALRQRHSAAWSARAPAGASDRGFS